MYVLQLKLPFNIVLVSRQNYVTEQAALEGAASLPGGFNPVKNSEVNYSDSNTILIPTKVKSLCKLKKSQSMKGPENSPSL
jgi:hypothetical protein